MKKRSAALLSSLLSLLILSHTACANVGIVGPNVRVTDGGLVSPADADTPHIAAQGNTVYAVWIDQRNYLLTPGGVDYSIYMAKSTDGGATWGSNVRVSNPDYEGTLDYPVIALGPNNQIWIAWTIRRCSGSSSDNRCGGQSRYNDVQLAYSDNGGASFTEVTIWDADDSISTGRQTPEIVVAPDTGVLYMLLHDVNGDGYDIFLRSVDLTNEQINTVKVSEGAGNGRGGRLGGVGPLLSLTMRGNTICAGWEDRRASAIYGACSTNRGQSFGPNFPITPGPGYYPRLALAPNGTLVAMYQQELNKSIFIRRSTDLGASWTSPKTLYTASAATDVTSLDLKVSDDNQVVAFWNSIYTNGDLYFAVSTDQGDSFTVITPVEDNQGSTPNIARQGGTRLAVTGSGGSARANLIWRDNRNTQRQIWSARATLGASQQRVFVPLAVR
ncbi:MAG: sialidase family protein [Anaerolineae bacterium]|nr:glycoside hydrolase [Candidatus Roseilinea sp.]MDW8450692.1 sialidase family protein [Anaerolineae bacterium]